MYDVVTDNVDVDCPVFDGLFKFCQIYAGGSVGGAYKLNRGSADICVNWAVRSLCHRCHDHHYTTTTTTTITTAIAAAAVLSLLYFAKS